MQSVTDLVEEWRLKAREWAELDGDARRLEKLEKIVFSEIVNQLDGSISSREHEARGHPNYRSHCLETVSARTKANVMKAELDGMEMKFEAWRTLNATKRAEMKHL